MRGVVLKESLLYIFNLFVRRLGINLVIEDNFILWIISNCLFLYNKTKKNDFVIITFALILLPSIDNLTAIYLKFFIFQVVEEK